ncbi:glycosyl hydrolase [Yeosuana marina]|uniref:glycosyl hydrolase n=1 Tax=Yeosuana marina TaxID=1565536 RepID=UPI001422C6D9|nr:glycosyl hydrolase [Yeosuana marina]
MVSPNCREEAPFGWLKEFHDKATAQDIRIDVIGVHWYDWGSKPKNSPNESPQNVFNRFKNYLKRVHDLYGLPIWITEFNANPNRSAATNYGFMQLALPYLETLDYIERYCWFQPSSGVADCYTDSRRTTLTDVGDFYNNLVSTPAIPEVSVTADSNLDIYYANSLGTADYAKQRFLIFPNPSTGSVMIRSSTPISAYKIFNSQEQLIKNVMNVNSTESEILMNNHPKEVYLILIKDTQGNTFSEKMMLR